MATAAVNNPPAEPRIRRERHHESAATPARRLTPAQVAEVLNAIERGLHELEIGPYEAGSASVQVDYRRGHAIRVGRAVVAITVP